jgi:hypothetical protein
METQRPTTGHERATPGIDSAADGGCLCYPTGRADSTKRAIGTNLSYFENLISGSPFF